MDFFKNCNLNIGNNSTVYNDGRKKPCSPKLDYSIQDTLILSNTNNKNKEEKLKRQRENAAAVLIKGGLNPDKAAEKVDTLSEEKFKLAKLLIDAGVGPYFVYSDIKNFSSLQVEQCLKLMQNGFDYTNASVAVKGSFNLDEIIEETGEEYRFHADEADGKCIKISASKSRYNPETGIITVIEKTYRDNGKKTVSRTEYEQPDIRVNSKGEYYIDGMCSNCSVSVPGETPQIGVSERTFWEINGENTNIPVTSPSRTHYVGSNRSIETEYFNNKNNIKTQLEILPSETGEPQDIIFTKQSDKLKGAYETVKYHLPDYDESRDIISEIKNGTIEGGEVFSRVTEAPDGSVTLEENFTRNGSNISRKYTETDNSQTYSYSVTDENGNVLMNLQRSFIRNDDGSTKTVINGREYTSVFDDENKTASITDKDGNLTEIDFKEIISGDETGEFWEFVKTLPADSLLVINDEVKTIIPTDKNSSAIFRDLLMSGEDSFIIRHELGHASDFISDWDRQKGEISSDEELNKIYEEESEAFNDEYPEVTQDIIRYFTQEGGSSVSGIAEVVAEAGALFGTYGTDTEAITTRGQYLVRFFPKTVAKIAELTGYNN